VFWGPSKVSLPFNLKTRDCQEVLCREKAKNMREDLT
jgi:hypothetical protein